MPVISLNRRFVEWDDKERTDPEIRRAFGLEEGGIGWDELLLKRRVIILAEAGSGKSTEMVERARVTAESQRYSLYATVEDVGQDGLESALSPSGRSTLDAWRASNEEAWLFIDSVDEAKSRGIRFEKILRRLADGIRGAEQRAHIILSGRITDWEVRRDFKSLKDWLPVSSVPSKPETTAEEELLRIVRQERRANEAPPPPEAPFVALMVPLDHNRIRLFAQGKSVPDLDLFLEAIDFGDLWHFARRPLDLDWLVRFWRSEGRLGSLAEMIERSISERLKETNTDRVREDTLDSAAAEHAIQRVGAAMVFGRRAAIAIPDSDVTFASDATLDLTDVLSDWPPKNRLLLLARPVFDPATLGRARFHNDNEGVVRSFLTAKWLLRLRRANLPTRTLFDLLFASSYGLEVIRPSLTETVAWLSLWDSDVANEVVRRHPSLLLNAGDPASLTPDVRKDVLVALMRELAADDEEVLYWDNDKVRRFAQPDLSSVIAPLWAQYRASKAAVQLLLRIIWLGALTACADLAYSAAFDSRLDSTGRVVAGRALLATCDDAARRNYSRLVMAESSTLPATMIRDAITDLFPTFISVPELLDVLKATNARGEEGELGFDTDGPSLAEKLNSPTDLEDLLQGLLTQVGGELSEHGYYPMSKREQAYFPIMGAAALRLLRVSAIDDAPEVAIDAILRIYNRRDHGTSVQAHANAARSELHRTGARRLTAFWRAAKSLRSNSVARRKVDRFWHIDLLGYDVGFKVEDIDCLLADGLSMGPDDCRLAVDMAFTIYRWADQPPELLERICAAVSSDATASEVLDELTKPRQPSPEHLEMERKREEDKRIDAAGRANRDQSWVDFIRELRSDQLRIARLSNPPASGFNNELIQLWRILNGASGASRYAIDTVAPLERIAGAEVAAAVRAGLIGHWRNTAPWLRSMKTAEERNNVRYVDLMGLTGVTLEAASVDGWAGGLSSVEAMRAAGYATLEINGLPRWISELATVWPKEVRAVLMAEITDEITRTDSIYRDTLQNVARGGENLAELLSPALLNDLETRAQMPLGVLPLVLQIIVRNIPQEQASRFIKLGVERFEKEMDVGAAVQYLAAVFSLDPKAATEVLDARFAISSSDQQAALVDRFLSASFGTSISGSAFKKTEVPQETLAELVRLSFQTHRSVPAQSGSDGVIYRVDENDHASYARNAVFTRFVKTPGAATYQALLRLQSDPNCPIPSKRLRELAEERAIQDSESAPWVPSDALTFEQHHETAPRTAKDLRSVLTTRLRDMQHDLLHGDFAQGATLRALRKEVEVQNWIADRLRLKQGRAFSVEREPHVVDEKEPDVRIRAKATDESVAMEIKVAETWTLKQLDEALEVQLCGRYLRASRGRYGVLLLVHQVARSKGWKDIATGNFLSFNDVIARLSARAATIAGVGHESPQPEVCVLDVSHSAT